MEPAASHLAENDQVAEVLDRVAGLLRVQQASPFRVRAWEHAATALRGLDRPVSEALASDGGDPIDGVGASLTSAIREIVRTGRLRTLARLEGEVGDDALFATIPGVGPTLAHRLASALDVHTLEQLEQAAQEGRLDAIRGIGPRRARAIRASIESTLQETTRDRARRDHERPSVEMLLAIDDEYRTRAREGRLPKIAPRRMNRAREAWLPIWHTERDGWHVTALFSNTARAHTLGTTRDWVVIYVEREDGEAQQYTVVTETRGPLTGRRVVRGRERESGGHEAPVAHASA